MVIRHRSLERPGLDNAEAPGARRAAEYVRMSTDHQKYSTENQADAIRQYAARRGLEIVRTSPTRERADCASVGAMR
jgi:hypothetical protein